MPVISPPLTVVRQVTNWGFAVAVCLDTDSPQRWTVVDAYGEMSGLGDPLRTDAEVARWTQVYTPGQWAVIGGHAAAPEDMHCGSTKRCDEDVIAIKLDQSENSPSWLVFTPARSVDLVDDDHVREWTTVYVAQDSDTWAAMHGLNPHPTTKEGIESW